MKLWIFGVEPVHGFRTVDPMCRTSPLILPPVISSASSIPRGYPTVSLRLWASELHAKDSRLEVFMVLRAVGVTADVDMPGPV